MWNNSPLHRKIRTRLPASIFFYFPIGNWSERVRNNAQDAPSSVQQTTYENQPILLEPADSVIRARLHCPSCSPCPLPRTETSSCEQVRHHRAQQSSSWLSASPGYSWLRARSPRESKTGQPSRLTRSPRCRGSRSMCRDSMSGSILQPATRSSRMSSSGRQIR